MHRMPIFLLLILAPWISNAIPAGSNDTPPAAAAAATAAAPAGNSFTQGLEYFKKNDFAHAREAFNQVLSANPQDPTLLYNLGLVEFADKHPGRALAYWRKALYLQPGYSPVLVGMAQLKNSKLLPPDTEENPLSWLYWRVPLSALLGLSLALFIGAGFLWVRFASQRKLDKPAPWLGFASTAVGFFFVMGLAVYDYQLYHFEIKATVMEPTVPAYSSPSSEAPSLFEFREGDEVTIRRTQSDWLQVQKSTTAVGWVKKNQILVHSGT